MTASEYVSAFASIILALAVADLATSMHRLLRARQRVRWHWLALGLALLVLLATVQYWWMFFDFWRSSRAFTLGGFLPDFVTLLLLFFLASAALPDEVPAGGLDLDAYYFENRTYIWALFALLIVSTTVSSILHRATSATTAAEAVRWILESGNVTLIVLPALLVATPRRWVHSAVIAFMLVALAWQWVALTVAD